MVVQKYVHDLPAWDALPIEQQELAMGRTKLSDLELPDELKPANSHIALNVIEDEDGEELQIMRFNMPFGRVGSGEYGTYFIGYASQPRRDRADARPTCSSAIRRATTDRILDFSTALTGNLFFVPSAGFLDDPPGGDDDEDTEDPQPAEIEVLATPPPPPSGDGSLGIGDLRRG